MKYLFLSFLLCGCDGMSNDKIISETAKCHAAGMNTRVLISGWDYLPRAVVCEPRQLGELKNEKCSQ